MSPRILFINGPPRCGKDTVGRLLETLHDEVMVVKMANELKTATHRLYNARTPDGLPAPANFFEDSKDLPSDAFLGTTPRKAYIGVSERYMKPEHGADVFGRLLLKGMQAVYPAVVAFAITDSGFRPEAVPIIEYFGAANCRLLRVKREGTWFYDSRSYISLEDLGVSAVVVSNNGTLDDLARELAPIVEWVKEGTNS